MRFLGLMFVGILLAISTQTAQAKSNKTWFALKIENPGSLTEDQVNLIQMSMVRLEDLPPMYYTAVARFDTVTSEITKPAKIFKLPMHHDGYVFLKVKPSAYIFTEEGQVGTHKVCYQNFEKVYLPKEGSINFLGTIDRNLIIKNVKNSVTQNSENDYSLTPESPTQNDVNNLREYMLDNKKVSRIKGDIVALEAQNVETTTFSQKSIKKLKCK